MFIILLLLNYKCFYMNFKLIVNILYFINFGNKEMKIKMKVLFMNIIFCCVLREYFLLFDMC